MLFGIKKKWSKCVSNLLKGLRLKSGSCWDVTYFITIFQVVVILYQFFLFSRSRVLLFQNLQFYTSPGISKKKNLKINKTWVDPFQWWKPFVNIISKYFFPTMFALIYSCILLIQFLLFTIIFQNIFLQLRYKVKERLSSIFCMIKWHLKTK